MTKLYLGGAEKGSYRSLLLEAGVRHFGMNFTHFQVPKRKELVLGEMFKGGEILVYTSPNDEDWDRYDRFLRDFADDLTIVVGMPNYNGEWLGGRYAPIWNDAEDLDRLAWLCQKYPAVAISDSALTGRNIGRIRTLQQRWGTNLVGLTSKVDHIEALHWHTVVVNSWTSVIRYGETQVWDGHGLRRYPAQQKESARKRHRNDIVRLGIDFDAVAEDDVNALAQLSIRSWQAWEANAFRAYDRGAEVPGAAEGDAGDGQVASNADDGRDPGSPVLRTGGPAMAPVETRHDSERVLLPVMGVEQIVTSPEITHDDQGEHIDVDPQRMNVVRYTDTSVRQCDSCYLSARCPAFKEHATCGFKLPVEIRSKDQLHAALTALIEMQVSRIMFARFAEELEGQGMDPALSGELERLFRLVDQFKNISDTRDTVKLTMEARSGAGALSRIFGQRAGEKARELPGGGLTKDQTEALYGEILDVE